MRLTADQMVSTTYRLHQEGPRVLRRLRRPPFRCPPLTRHRVTTGLTSVSAGGRGPVPLVVDEECLQVDGSASLRRRGLEDFNRQGQVASGR